MDEMHLFFIFSFLLEKVAAIEKDKISEVKNLKQNETQSARAESTHKGLN